MWLDRPKLNSKWVIPCKLISLPKFLGPNSTFGTAPLLCKVELGEHDSTTVLKDILC